MKTQLGPFLPETKASDCFDWITAEDVVRHALAAYYVACSLSKPSPGEPFETDGVKTATRGDFFDWLSDHFRDRLARHASTVGLQGFDHLAQAATNVERDHSPMPVRAHRL